MKKLTFVGMNYPCTSCVITQNLILEVVEKVERAGGVETETRYLSHPKEITSVPGIEVEKLPLLLLDGEQITAGNLISSKTLMKMIEE